MSKEPLPEDIPYEVIVEALVASEAAIISTCADQVKAGQSATYADLYAMGVARRSLALSSGFRSMVEQRNSLCALPSVRMQLDTVLRLYAGFFASDHQKFCADVIAGKHVDRLKSEDGSLMKDRYLLDRVAERNPWILDVYRMTSGYIHFSERHVFAAFTLQQGRSFEVKISPNDGDREPNYYREPMRCMHHLNLMIEFALTDWFARMCGPAGPAVSVEKYWSELGARRNQ